MYGAVIEAMYRCICNAASSGPHLAQQQRDGEGGGEVLPERIGGGGQGGDGQHGHRIVLATTHQPDGRP